MATLDIHHAEGRLDPAEYRERSAAAAAARHRSELDTLFADLPAPHPDYPVSPVGTGIGTADGGSRGPDAAADAGTTARRPGDGTDVGRPEPGRTESGRTEPEPGGGSRRPEDLPELVAPLGATLGRHAGKLSALVPVVAVVLFVLSGFRFPAVFLLVPVALGILGYLGHREGG